MGVHMNRTEYLAAVNEFMYQGEVLGEAVLGRWLQLESDPVRRYKWATLQQLETETKARLRPFMMRLGLGVVENDVSAQVAEFSKDFADKSWSELMELMVEVTDSYVSKFREIEAAAPDGEREVARSMIVHETALNDFAKRELNGDAENSLADVISLLQWPMARPAQNWRLSSS
jgi:hypothetical protein